MFIELAMALAIQTQTTTCNTVYGTTTCNTHTPTPLPSVQGPDPDAFGRAMRESTNSMPTYPVRRDPPATRDPGRCAGGDWFLNSCSLGAHQEAVRLRAEQQRLTAARERVMDMLRQGDCAGATAAALDTGSLDFATQVRAYCSAGARPVK